jgi:hypothetical protein
MAATGTRHMPDEHPVRTQPMAALAALRRQNHPFPIDGTRQITNAGHGVRVRRQRLDPICAYAFGSMAMLRNVGLPFSSVKSLTACDSFVPRSSGAECFAWKSRRATVTQKTLVVRI